MFELQMEVISICSKCYKQRGELILCHVVLDIVFDAVLNTLKPRQNGPRFPDDIFTCIFLNENV